MLHAYVGGGSSLSSILLKVSISTLRSRTSGVDTLDGTVDGGSSRLVRGVESEPDRNVGAALVSVIVVGL